MASRRNILNAMKAIPGGRPTPAPQGNAPFMGATSPIVQQMDAMNGYASAYGPFLPRPPGVFTQGAFGPFSPVLPVPVDTPEESGRAEPRREQEQVGWNLPVGEPGTEGIKLATYGTLRTLADLYSVARACIQTRKSEVRGLEWDIMPTTDAAKAHKGDTGWYKDFGERRAKAMRFFRRPDPDYFSWNTFIDAFLEEVFVFDALSLYLSPKRGKGMKKGLLGSDLDCLQLLSGPTIRPLYDIHGGYPRPPAPAYQQYLYGVPRSDFMQLVTGRDIEESGIAGAYWGQFRGDQLLYLPMVPRRWTPYGFPPIERALIPVMSGLQKQGWALDYFREGTVPAVYMSPGDESMTPNQIRELQDSLNAFAGDPAMHHKIIVLPPGTKVEPQRGADLADQFDEVIMNQVCMAFDVMPMELGISPKVSTTQSPGAANQMSKMSQSATQRKSTKPLLTFISDIMDAIIQDVCGQDDMKFVFEGTQEEEDQKQLTDLLVEQINAGLLSIDEGRDELNRQPWGLAETSGPVTITPTGPVPFGSMALVPGNPATGPQLPPGQGPEGDNQGDGGAPEGNGPQPKPAGGAAAKPAGQQQQQQKPAASGQKPSTPGEAAAQSTDSTHGQRGSRGSSGSTQATPSQASARPTGGGSKPAAQGVEKAITSELEALTRHLKKGRDVSTWVPKHITQGTLAAVSRHLASGLSPERAVDISYALTVDEIVDKATAPAPTTTTTTPPQQTPPVTPPPQPVWPAWLLDVRLMEYFGPKILDAFEDASSDIVNILNGLITGAGYLTWNATKNVIGLALIAALGGPLSDLWNDSWRLGDRSATSLLTGEPASGFQIGTGTATDHGDTQSAAERWVQGNLDEVLNGIANTNVDRLRPLPGQAPYTIDGVLHALDAANRSTTIGRTEVPRGVSAGACERYNIAGVTKVEWLTEPDPCKVCLANRDGSPVNVGDVFPSGAAAPPQHPNCRCGLAPTAFTGDLAAPDGIGGALKYQRRSVAMDGEVSWDEADYPPNAAGGGGQSPVRHWADGTQADNLTPVTGGVPGSTAGGEPPRWDTPVANGYQGGLNDFSDSIGRWPSGQNQTEAPPGIVTDDDPTGRSARGAWGVQNKIMINVEGSVVSTDDLRDAVQRQIMKFNALQSRGPDGRWLAGSHMSATHAHRIVSDTKAHGGNSVNPFTGKHPTSGYMVAEHDGSHIMDAKDFYGTKGSRLLQDYVDAHGKSFKDPNTHLGTWHDQQSGKVFLDVSHNVQDKQQAMDLGKKNNQIAIWDVAHGQEIPTGGTGGLDKAANSTRCPDCGMERDTTVSATHEFGKHLARQGKTFTDHFRHQDITKQDTPVAAGILVHARDTGRVLLLQRALDDDDPRAGMWEMPGGKLEPGEDARSAAMREWQEETGMVLPVGSWGGTWTSPDGVYRGHVYHVDHEADLPIHGGRDQVENPDTVKVDWDPGKHPRGAHGRFGSGDATSHLTEPHVTAPRTDTSSGRGDLSLDRLTSLSRDYLGNNTAAAHRAAVTLSNAGYSIVQYTDKKTRHEPQAFAHAMQLYKQARISSGSHDPNGAAHLSLYSRQTARDILMADGADRETADHVLAYFDIRNKSLNLIDDSIDGKLLSEIRDNAVMGWFTEDTKDHPEEHIINHEYGHALIDKLPEEKRHEMVAKIADTIPYAYPLQDDEDDRDWIGRNRAAVSMGVSEYGTSSSDEMLAELYANSVLSDSPTAAAKIVNKYLTEVATA